MFCICEREAFCRFFPAIRISYSLPSCSHLSATGPNMSQRRFDATDSTVNPFLISIVLSGTNAYSFSAFLKLSTTESICFNGASADAARSAYILHCVESSPEAAIRKRANFFRFFFCKPGTYKNPSGTICAEDAARFRTRPTSASRTQPISISAEPRFASVRTNETPESSFNRSANRRTFSSMYAALVSGS